MELCCDLPDMFRVNFGLTSGGRMAIQSLQARHLVSTFRNPFAPYRGQNPQDREKRVSESKTPISHHPRKGCSEKGVPSPKIPIFLVVLCIETGTFWLRAPFFGVVGKGDFLTPKPSFPHFGDFDPCALSFHSLVFWNSLVNFKQGISLIICVVSLPFPRFQWVRQGTKILG